MQGGKNWIYPKQINANRFFWDSHWLEIWSNHFCPSMGPNGGSVATDSVLTSLAYCLTFAMTIYLLEPEGAMTYLWGALSWLISILAQKLIPGLSQYTRPGARSFPRLKSKETVPRALVRPMSTIFFIYVVLNNLELLVDKIALKCINK